MFGFKFLSYIIIINQINYYIIKIYWFIIIFNLINKQNIDTILIVFDFNIYGIMFYSYEYFFHICNPFISLVPLGILFSMFRE